MTMIGTRIIKCRNGDFIKVEMNADGIEIHGCSETGLCDFIEVNQEAGLFCERTGAWLWTDKKFERKATWACKYGPYTHYDGTWPNSQPMPLNDGKIRCQML